MAAASVSKSNTKKTVGALYAQCKRVSESRPAGLAGGDRQFFCLAGDLPTCEEATKLALTIRRCEYQGNPADVKNLMHLLGWSKTKVLTRLKEVQEFFEFRTVKDPLDNRRSVQVLYGIESPATTEFFEKCLEVVDVLVEAREAAQKLRARTGSKRRKLRFLRRSRQWSRR